MMTPGRMETENITDQGPVWQSAVIDPNQSQSSNQLQVCSLVSLMYIVAIDINRK